MKAVQEGVASTVQHKDLLKHFFSRKASSVLSLKPIVSIYSPEDFLINISKLPGLTKRELEDLIKPGINISIYKKVKY